MADDDAGGSAVWTIGSLVGALVLFWPVVIAMLVAVVRNPETGNQSSLVLSALAMAFVSASVTGVAAGLARGLRGRWPSWPPVVFAVVLAVMVAARVVVRLA